MRTAHVVPSPVAEAESVEGLFYVLVGHGALVRADAENVAVRDIVLQLSLTQNHSAFSSLRPRTCEHDVGSMAPSL